MGCLPYGYILAAKSQIRREKTVTEIYVEENDRSWYYILDVRYE